jgi:hypothetical protein
VPEANLSEIEAYASLSYAGGTACCGHAIVDEYGRNEFTLEYSVFHFSSRPFVLPISSFVEYVLGRRRQVHRT